MRASLTTIEIMDALHNWLASRGSLANEADPITFEAVKDGVVIPLDELRANVSISLAEAPSAPMRRHSGSKGADNVERTVKVTGRKGRKHGEKRTAEEIEQMQQKLLKHVQDNPGQRIEEINGQLGTTTADVALPIRKLIADKKLFVQGEKRATRYYLTPPAKPSSKKNGSKPKAKGKAAPVATA